MYKRQKEDEATRKDALVAFVLPRNIQKMQDDLKKYRIEYDVWFRESELHKNGDVKRIIDTLTQKGLTYEKELSLIHI